MVDAALRHLREWDIVAPSPSRLLGELILESDDQNV